MKMGRYYRRGKAVASRIETDARLIMVYAYAKCAVYIRINVVYDVAIETFFTRLPI